ncbi:hypothetical protein [Massilia sp. NR 4-1]|uniref:hypothetical protein n=1 Tax=Massilia sp. NR 4-1 TaxID=1678028 RepID=UPI000AD2D3CB|nr:hypothetical protein [Massilia sp. NR 4-1]
MTYRPILLPASAAFDFARRTVWHSLNASHGDHFATAFLVDFAPQVLNAIKEKNTRAGLIASSSFSAVLNSRWQPALMEVIMDYSKMLFAAAVHNLSAHMRDREHPLDYKGGLDPDDYKDWLEEYPLSGYVPQALAAFKTVARQIDKIETEQ